MEKEELNELIKRYLADEASEQDHDLLDSWYLKLYENQPMEVSLSARLDDLDKVKTNLDWEYNKGTFKLWARYTAVAASIVLAVCIIFYQYKNRPEQAKTSGYSYVNDVAPGGNKATLILSNNEKINLSEAQNGELATQAGTRITKRSSGELVYTAKAGNLPEYNTIRTPKGGNYKVCLPDGTKVWLNAASSLKYPTAFTSLRERRVELSGEAYFEVTSNKSLPFRVATANQLVEVVGTHFNINSYSDEEAVKTTLLQGSVRINQNVILKPGQQAVNFGSSIFVNRVDTEAAVDWKDGLFSFNKGDDFKSAMRKIERWYDVEVVYNLPTIPEMEPGGWISRTSPISAVLKGIASTGKVHFKIEGRRITVTD
jgi:transmembrane sensor